MFRIMYFFIVPTPAVWCLSNTMGVGAKTPISTQKLSLVEVSCLKLTLATPPGQIYGFGPLSSSSAYLCIKLQWFLSLFPFVCLCWPPNSVQPTPLLYLEVRGSFNK